MPARRALEGVRVIDFSHYIAGPLTAMILADLGATVVRVDPPGGPRWSHPANALLQRGKQRITLDLHVSSDVSIAQRLIASADVVIESFRPGVAERFGIGAASSRIANGRLVYCSMPGFGSDDPRAGIPGWEGVICAATNQYRRPLRDPEGDPIFTAIPIASSFAAAVACHTIMAALIVRERTGRGQGVEVPLYDAVCEHVAGSPFDRLAIASAAFRERRGARQGQQLDLALNRCADGRWLHLCLVQARHVPWFARQFFPKEWIDAGMDRRQTLAEDPVARQRVADMFSTRPAREWERAINEQSGVPAGVCQRTEEWLYDDDHARESRAVIELDDPELGRTAQAGYPFQMSETPPEAQGPRHRLDADRAAILAELDEISTPGPSGQTDGVAPAGPPLDGIRMVDLSQVLAGPTAGRILAEYGAEVIKVHNPVDEQVWYDRFTNVNDGKQSIRLDLKHPEGREVLFGLLRSADVFHENFARGVAERMGIGEADVRALRPDIICSSISAFGREGYRGAYRGREELAQAITGIEVRVGGEGTPRMLTGAMNDIASGHWCAFAIMVALFYRMKTGVGQRVHTSLAHAATFHQVPYMVGFHGRVWDEPSGPDAFGFGPLDRIYRTADGYIYLAALGRGDTDRLRTIDALRDVDFDTDDEQLTQTLAEVFRSGTASEWADRVVSAGVGAHVVLDYRGFMADEAAVERGIIRSWEPDSESTEVFGPTKRLSETPPIPLFPSPLPGAGAQQILEIAGMGTSREQLRAKSVVFDELDESALREMLGRFVRGEEPAET